MGMGTKLLLFCSITPPSSSQQERESRSEDGREARWNLVSLIRLGGEWKEANGVVGQSPRKVRMSVDRHEGSEGGELVPEQRS